METSVSGLKQSQNPRKTMLFPDSCAEPIIQGGTVGVAEILQQIDREIAHLRRARALLNGKGVGTPSKPAPAAPKKVRRKKRNLTPDGRKRIADAVKRRWERQKAAAER
jgi:hypothetical protein